MSNAVRADVLWDNLFARKITTYSLTYYVGMEPINAYDWRDFTLFRLHPSGSFSCDMGGVPETIDTIVVWPQATAVAYDVIPSYSNDGGSTWTYLNSITIPAGFSGIRVVALPAGVIVKSIFRLEFNQSPESFIYFRQLAVGRRMQFPVGQWSGLSHPKLVQGLVVENQTAVNGSIVGRNVRRMEKRAKLSLDYCDPAWIRKEWTDFVTHASRKAFFWRWNPEKYPDDAAFAVAEDVPAPTNTKPAPFMSADLPIRFIA